MQITEIHFSDETETRVEVTFTQDGVELSGNWMWPIRDDGKAEAAAAFLAAQVPPLVKPMQKPEPELTDADVNSERDRLIVEGETFSLLGGGTIRLTGRQSDKDVYLAQLLRAQVLAGQGVTDPVMTFRDADNIVHNLTPAQMADMVEKAFAWFEAMMVRSWHMKDSTGDYAYVDEENPGGIPSDLLSNTGHWPTPV